jgi:hypothetical protein
VNCAVDTAYGRFERGSGAVVVVEVVDVVEVEDVEVVEPVDEVVDEVVVAEDPALPSSPQAAARSAAANNARTTGRRVRGMTGP